MVRNYKNKNSGEEKDGETVGKSSAQCQVHSITLSMGDEQAVTISGGRPVSPSVWAKMRPAEEVRQPIKICGRILDQSVLRRQITVNLLRRPLWHPYTVEECLDIMRRELIAMVERGQLPWAWDLGTSSKRKELRILGHSVIENAMGPIAAIGATKNLGLPEVVNLILPQSRKFFRSTDLQRIFHSGPDLIHHLSANGEIEKMDEERSGQGGKSSLRFTHGSVARLLEKRRIA
jgi:hypothetical protein